jgi:trans-aconitate methyltransferase
MGESHHGGFMKIIGYIRKLSLWRMQKVYKFEDWHTNPIELRPYALDIVKECNNLCLERAVEVGCGIGEIIGRLNCPERTGLDIEPHALMAAMSLNPRCHFKKGTFKDVDGTNEVDILIAVNFPHNIPPKELKDEFKRLTERVSIGYIVVDKVMYRYYHDWDKILPKCYKLLHKSRLYENGRECLIYRRSI